MRRLGALVVLLVIAAPSSAWPQAYTPEDEAACTPDVMRLCQQYIPNRRDIIACMVQHKRELSPECHTVFSRPQRAADDKRRRKPPARHQVE